MPLAARQSTLCSVCLGMYGNGSPGESKYCDATHGNACVCVEWQSSSGVALLLKAARSCCASSQSGSLGTVRRTEASTGSDYPGDAV